MLEKEYQKNDIELKFTTTLLQLALQLYSEKKFKEMINNNYEDISKMNEKIIIYVNESALNKNEV